MVGGWVLLCVFGCAEGFAVAAAIKHATRIINGPPAAKSGPQPPAPAAVAPSLSAAFARL